MISLWVNLRLWYWHLQVGPDRPYVAWKFNAHRWARHDCAPWIEWY